VRARQSVLGQRIIVVERAADPPTPCVRATGPWYCRANDGSHDSWHSAAYRELSISLVKKAHPTYTDAEATAAARKEFEAAALNFFLETLKVCQEVRPNARWGAYRATRHLCARCETFCNRRM
jgi:hypothetical protein